MSLFQKGFEQPPLLPSSISFDKVTDFVDDSAIVFFYPPPPAPAPFTFLKSTHKFVTHFSRLLHAPLPTTMDLIGTKSLVRNEICINYIYIPLSSILLFFN